MNSNKKLGAAFIVAFVLLVAFFDGVFFHEEWIDMTPPPPTEAEIDSLKTRVIRDGDIESYEKLSKVCRSKALPYAFFMANEHNYGKACEDIFMDLTTIHAPGMTVNEETAKLAMEYLKKGAELGDPACVWHLAFEYAFGITVPQDSALAFNYAFSLWKDSLEAEKHTQSCMEAGRIFKERRKKLAK